MASVVGFLYFDIIDFPHFITLVKHLKKHLIQILFILFRKEMCAICPTFRPRNSLKTDILFVGKNEKILAKSWFFAFKPLLHHLKHNWLGKILFCCFKMPVKILWIYLNEIFFVLRRNLCRVSSFYRIWWFCDFTWIKPTKIGKWPWIGLKWP